LIGHWQDDGATPLFIAAQKGHTDIVLELLGRGAAVDAPRVRAANYNHYYSKPVVNLIMIMMIRVRLGVLPLLLVVQVVTGTGSDYRDVCHRDLLGPGVFVLQNDGCPPLVMASINGHAATIRVLLEQGAVADRPRVRVPLRYLLVHRSKVDTQPAVRLA
jgi:ankyrin repeat protein